MGTYTFKKMMRPHLHETLDSGNDACYDNRRQGLLLGSPENDGGWL